MLRRQRHVDTTKLDAITTTTVSDIKSTAAVTTTNNAAITVTMENVATAMTNIAKQLQLQQSAIAATDLMLKKATDSMSKAIADSMSKQEQTHDLLKALLARQSPKRVRENEQVTSNKRVCYNADDDISWNDRALEIEEEERTLRLSTGVRAKPVR